MSANFHFSIDGKPVGPLDEQAIRQRIAGREITRETLAWRDGMAGWQPVGAIPELIQAYGDLLASQVRPPPLPGSGAAAAGPPPLPDEGQPAGGARAGPESAAGLRGLDASAYRFVMWLYRPWGGRSPPLRAYVEGNPKRALPVAVGTVVVIALVLASFVMSLDTPAPEPEPQVAGQPPQTAQQGVPPMAGGNWRDQYHIQRDLHNYNQSVIDDVIRNKQRSDERRMETDRYRYDWYGKKD